ncbi:MAG: hypothetical protein WBH47_09080, partial [Streptosporangiaceae bacterium]
MSAESPRGSADLTTSASSDPQPTSEPPPDGASRRADFGPNQWLVDELYQRYLTDPGSVDQAWWSFFADYQPQPDTPAGPGPGPGSAAAATTSSAGAAAPAG